MASQRPRYPAISLPVAIDHAEKLFKKEGRSAMSSEVVVRHLGYSSLNGASLKVLAALKKYGLLEGRKDDISITQDAIVAIADKNADDQAERSRVLMKMLKSDPVFNELWGRFADRSSELNIISYLIKHGFKGVSAEKAAKSYLDSVKFVSLEIGDYNIEDESENDEEENNTEINQSLNMSTQAEIIKGKPGLFAQSTKRTGGAQEIPIPIPGGVWPVLKIPVPVTEEFWKNMTEMLKHMKPALVENAQANEEIKVICEPQDGE